MSLHRRRRLYAACSAVALFPVGAAALGAVTQSTIPITLETVTNLDGPPLALDYAPGDTGNRLFIAGQTTGHVRLLKNGSLEDTPFLSTATGGLTLSPGSEKGLLGIAFHPNYSAAPGTPGRGKFYTYTSEPKGLNTTGVDFVHPEQAGSNGGDHDGVFREWTADPTADVVTYNVANPSQSSREIYRFRQPQGNHNGGAIRFDTSGYLYIASGDGGSGDDHSGGVNSSGDGHTSPQGNGQDNTNPFGKILRIDPLHPSAKPGSTDPISANGKYRVPASNPFAAPGNAGMDEVFAWGLRNPFRMHFDRQTGTLYAGDVGQQQREEIDIITSGGNYGWPYFEGTLPRNVAGRTVPPGFTDIDPIAEYTHADGAQAVIGGTVYRGSNFPDMAGKYVFGELDANTGRGRLFFTNANGGAVNEFDYVPDAVIPGRLYSFGEDKDGELYAMFDTGAITRLLGRQWMTNGGGSWNNTANWLLRTGETSPNANGAQANFLGRFTNAAGAPATITLDGNRVVGALRFNNTVNNGINSNNFNSYVIAQGSGGGTLTINGGASAGLIHVIKGTHTVSAPLSIGNSTNLQVDAGTLNVTSILQLGAGFTLTKLGAGDANLAGISGPTGNLALTAGTVRITPGSAASRLGSASAAAGKLDLTNNRVIFTGMPLGTFAGPSYTGVLGLVDRGRNEGAWDGPGLMTGITHADTGLTTLAVATVDQLGLNGQNWGGQTVNNGQVLVRYTYGGDADLSGSLDSDDYFRIDSNFNLNGSVFGYYNGDFDYNGAIDSDDYFIIDSNWNNQVLGALGSLTAVPEPNVACVLASAALGALRRRRAKCTPR